MSQVQAKLDEDDEPRLSQPEDILVDLGDPEQVRKKKAEAKLADLQRVEMVRAVVGLSQGRKWLREIIFDWCHVNQPSIHNMIQNMGLLEGERNIGQRLIADIVSASPKDYLKILQGEESTNG